jgi:putative transposase
MTVTRLCALYRVTRAGYYAWRHRPASARQGQDRILLEEMGSIFERSGGTYGSPRLHRALAARGHRISRRRVERLMRVGGWRARLVRVYRRKAGMHRWFGQHPNRVRRTRATRPNQIWVGDVTYLAVGSRWWYMATVLDQYSRRVLAWRLGSIRDSRLTRATIEAALRRRRPAAGLIFHSDRGSEYLGGFFRQRLDDHGVQQSMTRGGAPDENAHMESFFHSLKADVIHGRRFQSVEQLRSQLHRYVRYYNHQRLHSALSYRSPVDYEHGAA